MDEQDRQDLELGVMIRGATGHSVAALILTFSQRAKDNA